ncbi:MAG TPA: hypothetical protein VGM69_13295 [Chloroflexota bacterium]|jgi:hypothetical protein
MQENEIASRIASGLDVCDANGDKIGTVARMHQPAMVGGGGATTEQPSIIEVRTGILGLGKHLYVPISAVQDVTEGCLFLSASKDAVDGLGWYNRPAGLDDSG